MPTFRCTRCERRVDSPVVIGAGDCPHCGGDVVFDIRTSAPEKPGEESPPKPRRSFLRRWRRR